MTARPSAGAVVALVPAAGRGVRLGAGTPKAFARLHGRPLLWHAVGGLLGSGCVDRVVVAVAGSDRVLAATALDDVTERVRIVTGGTERSDSVRAALEAVTDADIVLVHDAARCLIPPSVIRSVVDAVRAGHRAVVPVLPCSDTVKQVDDHGTVITTVDRAVLRVAQTPQGFDADLLRRAYATGGGHATDDAELVERLGEAVTTVAGHPRAFKITTPFDLAVAEAVAGAP
ncbi:MAG: 2-C-methyl-D-erythritol 4-phosphate cytidylyltransferase [Pseudonocardiaceae bacterium]|nr:2-C-methyl-D-erythritol 4-phosphate cytidylyltransferase [Pseudonocardiaceae bacterium]